MMLTYEICWGNVEQILIFVITVTFFTNTQTAEINLNYVRRNIYEDLSKSNKLVT